MHKNPKITWNVLMSFLIWTSVFVFGILISSVVLRACLAGGSSAYRWLHP